MTSPVFSVRFLLLLVCASLHATESPSGTPIAIMPLQSRTLDAEALEVLGSTIASELMATGTVRVMERAQMEKILQEQGFQQSGACDGSECAVEIGRLLTVDRILLGSVGRFGNAYSLSLRMVDVQSGEILRSTSKTLEGPQEAILTRLAPDAVRDVLGLTPPKPKRDPAKEYPGKKGSFKDPRDGKTYPWIRIGQQVWMTRNLDRDTIGGICYQAQPRHCTSYGRLYAWNTARIVCPQDWHLPSSTEWDTLVARAGGLAKAGALLKDNRVWDGVNELGFRALPAGELRNDAFTALEGATRFWSSSPAQNDDRKTLSLFLQGSSERVFILGEDRNMGMSVRCLLDSQLP